MKVSTERKPDCTTIITVQVDEDQVRRAMVSAAQRVSRSRPIAGFRPGKAPYDRVERAVGKEALLNEAIDGLAQTVYKQVLRDEKIEPYDVGKLEVKKREPLVLEFTVPTRPVVTLGDYRAIHLKPRGVEVSDEQVQEVLERLRREQATLTPVARPAQLGDIVTMDIRGGFEDQEPIDRKGLEVTLDKEEPLFPWQDQVLGANMNENLAIKYTYPKDDPDPARRVKTVTYSATITDIKEPQLPNVDDDFAQSVSEYETAEELRRQIREGLHAQKQAEEEDRFANEVVDTIVQKSKIAFPASMLEDEINLEVERAGNFASRLGLTLEKYLELAGKSEAQLREEARPVAEKKIRRLLTLLELIRAENVSVSREDVDREIEHQTLHAVQLGRREKQVRRTLSTSAARKDIEWNLKVRRAVERVVAIARGEATSGKILTPEIVRREEQRRERKPKPEPRGDLITDPSKVPSENWPSRLRRILVPGRDK